MPPAHRRAEDPRDRHTQEGRRHVGPVIDVVEQPAVRARPALRQIHRIDVQQQGEGRFLLRDFRVENEGPAVAQFENLRPGGILAEQKADVRGVFARVGDGQEHGRALQSVRKRESILSLSLRTICCAACNQEPLAKVVPK